MTRVIVNGEGRDTAAPTMRELIMELTGTRLTVEGRPADGSSLGIAVARGDAVIPRRDWARTPISPGDRYEIVTAKQGG